MKIIPKISDSDFECYESHKVMFREYESLMLERVSYILDKICEHFNDTKITWYFTNAGDYDCAMGDFDFSKTSNKLHKESCVLYVLDSKKSRRNFEFKDKYDIIWDLAESFPFRWLSEDFEEELLKC